MRMTLKFILMLAAFFLFGLAALEVKAQRVNLEAAGLALAALSFLVG